MHERNETTSAIPAPGREVLAEILRDGAQRLLGQAIEAEVDTWIEQHAPLRNAQGHQQVVRNDHHPPRERSANHVLKSAP
jgi:putative transposase